MRVGASSGAWIATFFTFVAFDVGFVMVATQIQHEIAVGLIVVFSLLALISAYGAYRAHYRPNATAATAVPHTPGFITSSVSRAILKQLNAEEPTRRMEA